MAKTRGGLQKRGKIWYAVWREAGRQRWQSTGHTSKSDARDWLANRMAPLMAADTARSLRAAADAAEAQAGRETGMRLRIGDVWQIFLDAPQRSAASPATTQNYTYHWNEFVSWSGNADEPVSAITATRAADYARWLRGKTGASNYNLKIVFLRYVWRTLAKTGLRLDNPWADIALAKSPPHPRRELTAEEIMRLLDTAQGEWRTLIATGLYTGLRLADCATLRWDETDIGAGLIRRTPRKTARSTNKIVEIPIHSALMPFLKAAHPPWPDRPPKYVMPVLAARILRSHNALHAGLARIFDRAGIQRKADELPPDRVRTPVEAGFHSLRHTFVSICARAGVQASVVQEIVGHSSSAMTRHYTHIGTAAAQAAIASLPDWTRPESEPAPEPLPEWAAERLRLMTARNWRQTRDGILADAARATPATTTPTAPPAPAISTHAGIAPHATPAPQQATPRQPPKKTYRLRQHRTT